jgi:hypothetical protein
LLAIGSVLTFAGETGHERFALQRLQMDFVSLELTPPVSPWRLSPFGVQVQTGLGVTAGVKIINMRNNPFGVLRSNRPKQRVDSWPPACHLPPSIEANPNEQQRPAVTHAKP